MDEQNDTFSFFRKIPLLQSHSKKLLKRLESNLVVVKLFADENCLFYLQKCL